MNLLFTVIGGKFKFQVQDSFLEYFFWRFGKRIALSEKKPPLKFLENGFCLWTIALSILNFICSPNYWQGKDVKKNNQMIFFFSQELQELQPNSLLMYRKVASSRLVNCSILETSVQRSQCMCISIKFPLNKHSEIA